MEQQIRFCTAYDGVTIAYAKSGAGPPLVKAANWLNHLEFDWNSPVWRHWFAELSAHHTLVRYDERGNGLSDWDIDSISLEDMVADLEAVVDAAGLERFTLLGISQGCPVSIAYSVRHPERVDRMILHGGYALGHALRDDQEAAQRRAAMVELIPTGWGQANPAFRQVWTTLFVPDSGPEHAEWFNELQQVCTSPENAVKILRGTARIDVTDLLGQVSVPALVTHSRGDAVTEIAEAKRLAAGIPGAQLAVMESRNHLLLEDDPAWPRFVTEIRTFLGVQPPSSGSRRAALAAKLQPGEQLGRYRISAALGAGSMGQVYRAFDDELKREVAVKVLPAELAEEPSTLARFRREAKLLAAVNHESVPMVFGVGERAGIHYMAMELVAGESLAAKLLRGPLQSVRACAIARQVAEAVAAAHERDIVHRDLKPSNVVVLPDDRAKVLDFGIAKSTAAGAGGEDLTMADLTATGVLIGTAPYMSPEQVRGLPVDTRTDVWSFGCLLWEALVGESPFRRDTVADTLAAILGGALQWDRLPVDVPVSLRQLLSDCLQGDRRQRRMSMQVAAEALARH